LLLFCVMKIQKKNRRLFFFDFICFCYAFLFFVFIVLLQYIFHFKTFPLSKKLVLPPNSPFHAQKSSTNALSASLFTSTFLNENASTEGSSLNSGMTSCPLNNNTPHTSNCFSASLPKMSNVPKTYFLKVSSPCSIPPTKLQTLNNKSKFESHL